MNGVENTLRQTGKLYLLQPENSFPESMLLQVALPAFLGSSGQGAASNPWSNIGSLENKGVELTLNTVNIDTKDFQWRSNFVFSLNRNKVVEMDTETGSLPYSLQVSPVGVVTIINGTVSFQCNGVYKFL